MGIVAQYQGVPQAELDELIAGDPEDVYERCVELAEEYGVEDIDKFWDALHFALTGVPGTEGLEGDAISEAICGVTFFEVDDGCYSYIPAAEVPRIRSALDAVDDAQIIRGLDPVAMAGRVYPEIRSEDAETYAGYLAIELRRLRDFYAVAEGAGHAVIVGMV